jgi:peptide/nickel transport system permease protein
MTLDYALRRVGFFLVVVWVTITAMFVLVRLAPGDPISDQFARLQARGQSLSDGPELIARYKRELGLDDPLYRQYLDYVAQVAQGNLGYSVASFPTSVASVIGEALPWTLGLLVSAVAIAWVVGSVLGGLLAWRSTPALARGLMSSLLLLAAVPYYLIALLLLYVFAYRLHWLPTGGGRDPLGSGGGALGAIADTVKHGLLPALSIVLAFVGSWMLGMRSLMVGILDSDYLRLAEAKGLSGRRMFLHYGLRTAIAPQLTTLAINIGYVVSGSILVEVLFSYPGIGTVLVDAIEARDYPVVQGVVLTTVVTAAGALLILDLVLPLIDPRVRGGRN